MMNDAVVKVIFMHIFITQPIGCQPESRAVSKVVKPSLRRQLARRKSVIIIVPGRFRLHASQFAMTVLEILRQSYPPPPPHISDFKEVTGFPRFVNTVASEAVTFGLSFIRISVTTFFRKTLLVSFNSDCSSVPCGGYPSTLAGNSVMSGLNMIISI
jgi:hypothetical protein